MIDGKKIAAGVLGICPGSKKILLGRRGFKGAHPNCWASFGGKFDEEKDITPRDTANREFGEETGYYGRYLLSKTPVYIESSNHLDFYNYLGIFDQEISVNINDEHLDWGWFPLDALDDANLHPGTRELLNNPKAISIINNIINGCK